MRGDDGKDHFAVGTADHRLRPRSSRHVRDRRRMHRRERGRVAERSVGNPGFGQELVQERGLITNLRVRLRAGRSGETGPLG